MWNDILEILFDIFLCVVIGFFCFFSNEINDLPFDVGNLKPTLLTIVRTAELLALFHHNQVFLLQAQGPLKRAIFRDI